MPSIFINILLALFPNIKGNLNTLKSLNLLPFTMETKLSVKIITSETSTDEIIELSVLSGPSNEEHYKKLMKGFIANSLSPFPDLDQGIVYGLYDGKKILASARIKQDEYTSTIVSIEYLAVKPSYKGQGFGTIFMMGLFKEIKERWGKKIAMLATGESKMFYEKTGMKIFGELKDKVGHTRFYMYKLL